MLHQSVHLGLGPGSKPVPDAIAAPAQRAGALGQDAPCLSSSRGRLIKRWQLCCNLCRLRSSTTLSLRRIAAPWTPGSGRCGVGYKSGGVKTAFHAELRALSDLLAELFHTREGKGWLWQLWGLVPGPGLPDHCLPFKFAKSWVQAENLAATKLPLKRAFLLSIKKVIIY